MDRQIIGVIKSWDRYSGNNNSTSSKVEVKTKTIKRGKTPRTKYIEVNNKSLFEKTFRLLTSFDHTLAFRDLFFLKHLSNKQIAPEVQHVWIDEKKQTVRVQMTSYTCDIEDFAKEFAKFYYQKQKTIAKEYRYIHILPDYILKKMLALVLNLDKEGIVHGDLKLSQFLYSPISTNVVLTDYGFAGFSQKPNEIAPILGWPVGSATLGCQTFAHCEDEAETITTKHKFVTQQLLPMLNRWELDVCLWISNVGIYDSVTKNLQPYGGLSTQFLPRPIQQQFGEFCQGKEAKALQDRIKQTFTTATHYILEDCQTEIV